MLFVFSGIIRMTSCISDDPDKLLNEWLGELENLIGVRFSKALVFSYLGSPAISQQ